MSTEKERKKPAKRFGKKIISKHEAFILNIFQNSDKYFLGFGLNTTLSASNPCFSFGKEEVKRSALWK